MVLTVLRALFVLLMAAVGWFFVKDPAQRVAQYSYWSMAAAMVVALLLVVVDIFSPRKKLAVFSSVILGLLVGIAVAYAGSFVVALLVDRYLPGEPSGTAADIASWERLHNGAIRYADLVLGFSCCYLSISFILQTRDDFRFVIPYVEFSKQIKGARPILVDTSVLIDGRITDIALTGILESQLIIPQFVLDELHRVADSPDKNFRGRGRMGLDVLNKLQHVDSVDVALYTTPSDEGDAAAGSDDVDQRLIELAKRLNARVLTNDFNLNKVAQFRGVSVVNLNALAAALKPVVRVGERMTVAIQKVGDLPGQGVGYLQDGTMVVVEQARGYLDEDVDVLVTNTRQTSAGRMIFGRLAEPGRQPPRSRPPAEQPHRCRSPRPFHGQFSATGNSAAAGGDWGGARHGLTPVPVPANHAQPSTGPAPRMAAGRPVRHPTQRGPRPWHRPHAKKL